MKLKDYLENNILLTDGAFGTYYALKYGHDTVCEHANITHPERVRSIHNDYIRAGARLLRTNTFAANKYLLESDEDERTNVIKSGYAIALECAEGKDVYVAADIGPVSSVSENKKDLSNEEKLAEFKKIIDVFLECGARIFLFETMTSAKPLDEAVAYLRKLKPDAYIICQFALHPDSHTGSGISLGELFSAADKMPADALGLNCASGPVHVLRHIKKVKKLTHKTLSALPNASFPERVGDRMHYSHNEKYFADIAADIVAEGVKIIGGCCGTTPGHIRLISDAIKKGITLRHDAAKAQKTEYTDAQAPAIDLMVEVSPPLKASTKGLIKRINSLKDMGVGCITLPDSPLGRARMNPLMVSGMVRESCGVGTIAHLCCRDRNITALRSDVLAAWAMGLRKVLCVTGDPVAAGSRDNIKSVFNISGTRLIELIAHMNSEFFAEDPIDIYAAVNFSAPNFQGELKRCEKKAAAGAKAFLSQPIFAHQSVENIKTLKYNIDAKVYAGIMPPVSYRNALFLNNEVPGITIPAELLEKMKSAASQDQQQIGIRYAVDIAKHALAHADGIYLMLPFGKISVAAQFFDEYEK